MASAVLHQGLDATFGELSVVRDEGQLARVAADRFAALAAASIAERGCFAVALAGGSTPGPMYSLLAEPPLAREITWERVVVFWGDERCVPPGHPDSNYRMARDSLLDRVHLPEENVYRVRGELSPQQAAAHYRMELQKSLGADGRFDLVLLGMGADGHTASLFPGTAALEERERSVVPVYVEELDSWRVTLTLPAINAARAVIFQVSGFAKAGAVARIHAGEDLPASRVRPVDGQLIWLVDRDAADPLFAT